MAKVRQQQHRPARDNQRSRELNDLRRENSQLAKQNARLRKQVAKVTASADSFEGPALAHERSEAVAGQCSTPECSGQVKRVDLGRATFEICPICKIRTKVDG